MVFFFIALLKLKNSGYLIDNHYLYARDPAGIRTQDPQLRRLLLYPAELPDRLVPLWGCAWVRLPAFGLFGAKVVIIFGFCKFF